MSYAPKRCSNLICKYHQNSGGRFIKKGFYFIKRLRQRIRKYQCKNCLKIFSSRTFKPDYKHKKMDLNFKLAHLLTEGVSLRSASRIIGLTYRNTYKKFLWFKNLVQTEKAKLKFVGHTLQFDELETIHHTKCKPLSIILVVNENHELLEAQVAEMPAKGRLAAFSRMKYGFRKDQRPQKLAEALDFVKVHLHAKPNLIQSDANPSYSKQVRSVFPETEYKQYNRAKKERLRNRIHEKLNKKKFDPLFAVNHKCALLRSQIKRLTRRSWCTTKKVENLQLHLDLFILMQFGFIF